MNELSEISSAREVGYRGDNAGTGRKVKDTLTKFVGPRLPGFLKNSANKKGGIYYGTCLTGMMHITPNDLTIAGLQLTTEAVEQFCTEGKVVPAIWNYINGSVTDWFDGALATVQDAKTLEGAQLDVGVDRMVEVKMARVLKQFRDEFGYPDKITQEIYSELPDTFFLSTLTKAFAVLNGINPGENDIGGMPKRRIEMLKNMATIAIHRRTEPLLNKIVHNMDERVIDLHQGSLGAGKRRIGRILRESSSLDSFDYLDNVKLSDPTSETYSELLKYITVNKLAQDLLGVDMVEVMNGLAWRVDIRLRESQKKIFPSVDEVIREIPDQSNVINKVDNLFALAQKYLN